MLKNKRIYKRAFQEDGLLKTHIGGQALIEGIMMRGKYNWSVAAINPQGTIETEEFPLDSPFRKHPWLKKPFIRGSVALVDSLLLGSKALQVAAGIAFREEEPVHNDTFASTASAEEAAAPTEKPQEAKSSKQDTLTSAFVAFSVAMGIVIALAVFVLLPAVMTNFMVGDYDNSPLLWNLVDGFIRVAIFVLYIALIGRMKDVDRMFAFHGAEHKTIHCYEHGLDLTYENAQSFPRLHVRCGTAFLIMVMIIAILVYTMIPMQDVLDWARVDFPPLRFALLLFMRIALLPLIAGVSYEVSVKWAGNHPDNPLVRIILWPGLQMQYLTTREPDKEQICCAIEAMKLVVACEEEYARNNETCSCASSY